ncbi:MAG TPA: response regulator [Magnetospirillaceae bacterium]|nr:response regulator [Magnetospirillaceae bacterium]
MRRATILIVEESELFREYLRSRLERFNLNVEIAINGLDGSTKLRSILPDVVILDYHLSRRSCTELLEEKARNPNSDCIPVILTAQKIDRSRLLELAPFGIRKMLMKPIHIDALYQVLSEILGLQFEIDTTPCVIDAHVNDTVLFIEIAHGLNREKIGLLRFKIPELLELYGIAHPRVLLLMTDMELSFVDGPNLEELLDAVRSASRARNRHIRILTRSPFVREFVKGRSLYADIEVAEDLRKAMDGLLADPGDTDAATGKYRAATECILAGDQVTAGRESMGMQFESESRHQISLESLREAGKGLDVAVVDDDFVIQQLVRTAFGAISASVTAYPEGRNFLDAVRSGRVHDLVFLDILMPGISGFDVLDRLGAEGIDMPVIILSSLGQKDAVLRALKKGVKSYLIKPLKSEHLLRKAIEILKSNF